MNQEDYIKQIEEENATLRSRLEEALPYVPQWVYNQDVIPPKHANDLLEYRKEIITKMGGVFDANYPLMSSMVVIVAAEYKIKQFVIGKIYAGEFAFSWDRVDRRGMQEKTVRFKHAKDKIEAYWKEVSGG